MKPSIFKTTKHLYSKISGTGADFPGAAAMSVILMAICCLVIGAGEIYAVKKEDHFQRGI